MKNAIALLLVLSIFLAACSSTQGVSPLPTLSDSDLATQVSALLTSLPSATGLPVAAGTDTVPPDATSTRMPTLAPTATNTLQPIPSLTPSLTVTHTATPTPMATPTVPPTDPKLKLGNPTWQDNFKNGDNWPSGSNGYTSIDVSGGFLKLTALTNYDGWRLTYPVIKNFYIETILKTNLCAAADHYGMIVRVPDPKKADHGYLFGISCDGMFSLRNWDGSKMNGLSDWTTSPAILTGANQTNRLGLMAVNDQFALYINGVLVGSVKDSDYSEGSFGVFVGSKKTPNLTVWVSQVSYWENP